MQYNYEEHHQSTVTSETRGQRHTYNYATSVLTAPAPKKPMPETTCAVVDIREPRNANEWP
eukprot:16738-Heterococcus_DN1.PRE.2